MRSCPWFAAAAMLVFGVAAADEPRVPLGFKAAPGTSAEPYTNTGWAKEVIHEKTGIEMVFIPAGEFMMGSPDSEPERGSDEGPVHRVRITKPFYLGTYEVTQAQWTAVMGSNPSTFQGINLPVENISWIDCQGFLAGARHGLRLPTEAEWEYACRAGTRAPFCFGNTITTDQVNHDGSLINEGAQKGTGRNKTTPVGTFPPNAWGLYDMHGNVSEWCQDWFDEKYYGRSPESDPPGPSSGQGRWVHRGGAWSGSAAGCSSAGRDYGGGEATDAGTLGFRVARGLQ